MFGQLLIFSNSLFQHIVVPTRASTLQPLTCRAVGFLNARPFLSYETETLIRDMVFSESDEESMTNPKMSQFHFVPIYPFKPRVRHFFCRALQSYNSPGD